MLWGNQYRRHPLRRFHPTRLTFRDTPWGERSGRTVSAGTAFAVRSSSAPIHRLTRPGVTGVDSVVNGN